MKLECEYHERTKYELYGEFYERKENHYIPSFMIYKNVQENI